MHTRAHTHIQISQRKFTLFAVFCVLINYLLPVIGILCSILFVNADMLPIQVSIECDDAIERLL